MIFYIPRTILRRGVADCKRLDLISLDKRDALVTSDGICRRSTLFPQNSRAQEQYPGGYTPVQHPIYQLNQDVEAFALPYRNFQNLHAPALKAKDGASMDEHNWGPAGSDCSSHAAGGSVF